MGACLTSSIRNRHASERTYAEKVRAAITRTPPAIRDIYDIDDAVRTGRIDIFASDFLALVRKKLAVSMNSPISISVERKTDLRAQLESALKPVLRARDYNGFAIDRALDHVDRLVAMLAFA